MILVSRWPVKVVSRDTRAEWLGGSLDLSACVGDRLWSGVRIPALSTILSAQAGDMQVLSGTLH